LLNHAARYFPILEELQKYLPPNGKVVEIGSGSVGMGEFWSLPFVGCDLSFAHPPHAPMQPVICSAEALPFPDCHFDAVISSDVLEHIDPKRRRKVVSEIVRVTRTVAIVAYPCGQAAWALDQELYWHYKTRRLPLPNWLQEHMLHPFPDETLFTDLPGGWKMRIIHNESLRFHSWVMRAEIRRAWNYSFRMALRMAPGLVRRFLRYANREPCYRTIVVMTRG
jgi:SAM-dependent methyltransferase